MRALKLTIVTLLVVAALIGFGLGGAFAWLGTEAGTQWVFARLLPRVAPYVSVQSVAGSLWERMEFRNVRVVIAGHEISTPRLTVEWHPEALLAGALWVSRLESGAVLYRAASGEMESPSGGSSALPLRISIDEGAVEQLTIATAEDMLALEDVRFAAELEGSRLRLSNFAALVGELDVHGQGELDWSDALALRAAADWRDEAGDTPLSGRLDVEGDWPELTVHHELEAPFRATANGSLSFGAVPRATFDVVWTDMAWPTLVDYSSRSGRLHIDGAVDGFHYEGAAELEVLGERLHAQIAGRGEGAFLNLDRLTVEHAAGSVVASGDVALDALEWRIELTAGRIDPAALYPGWPGQLTGTGVFSGRLLPALEWNLEGGQLSGVLRGYPVRASGGLSYAAPGTWRLASITAESGADHLALDGVIDQALALTVSIAAPDLDSLWPEMSGTLAGSGRISGTAAEPVLEGELSGGSVTYQDFAAGVLTVRGRAGLAGDAPLALEFDAAGLRRGAVALTAASGRVVGTTRAHDATLELSAGEEHASLAAHGGIEAGAWRGEVARLDVTQRTSGDWHLVAPAAFAAGTSGVELEEACLAQEIARICGSLRYAGGSEDLLKLEAHDFDAALLRPLTGDTVTADGRYEASLSLRGPLSQAGGTLAITSEATRVTVQEIGEQPLTMDVEGLMLSVMLEDDRLDIRGAFSSPQSGTVALEANVANVRGQDPRVAGRIDMAWPDVAFLSLLSPDIGEVTGTLDVHLTLAGTLNSPVVEGRATWRGGSVMVPRWGLAVEQVEVDASSANGEQLQFTGAGLVGESRLAVSGTTDLDRLAGWPTRLEITGDSILAVQQPDAQIYVTPDLVVEAKLPDVYVTGTVHVPRADIRLAELPEQAVTPSEDTVLHGVEQPPASRPLHVHGDLMLTLGDDVHYSGSGLSTQVNGEMRLGYESGRPASARGTLTLSGQYNAYGRLLDLDRGQLLFTGPLEDPALDVRAIRKIDQRTVGVQLTGTLQAPVTRMFSDPAASEADALSYLLLGRPLTGSGAEETATLQSAAIAMGLQQALPAVQRIGESLGLDEFTVRTTDTDAGELMAGKYLSRRMYIRYTYGLFNRIGGLMLRFRVNDRLSLETRSGDEKSMDVLYTVDKD